MTPLHLTDEELQTLTGLQPAAQDAHTPDLFGDPTP